MAYNRKQYLAEAINSVINQKGIDKKDYEIIVLKNFKDKKIDNLIKKNNIREIYNSDKKKGKKIVEGIKYSKNNIISILDDDDLFLDDKLKTIKKIFDRQQNLIFYYNRQFRIISNFLENLKLITIYNREDFKKNNILESRDKKQIGGDSSISFKKELFNKMDLSELSKINISTDDFILSMALLKKVPLFLDKKKLTVYRIHNKNISVIRDGPYSDYIKNRKKYLRLTLADSQIIHNLGRSYVSWDLINEIEYKIWCNKLQIGDIPKMIKAGMWKHLFYFINKGFLKRKMYETQLKKFK